jgi:DNA-binding CsgD family transcriptional regulator
MADIEGENAAWEQFFWGVFENSSNPLILLDEDRLVVDLNEPMCGLIGAARDAVVGRKADVLSDPQEVSSVEAEWEKFWDGQPWAGVRTLIGPEDAPVRIQYAVRPTDLAGKRVAVAVCLPIADDVDAVEEAPVLKPAELTTNEREIISFVALGSAVPEIAAHLALSTETVEEYVQSAMTKTGARTQAQLVAMAFADRYIIGGD